MQRRWKRSRLCAFLALAACRSAPPATAPDDGRSEPAPVADAAASPEPPGASEPAASSAPELPAEAPAPAPADPAVVREAIARLDAASSAWARSCKSPDASGLCVAVRRTAPVATHCAPRVFGDVTVRPRARAATQAHTDLERAVADTIALADPVDAALAAALHEARGRAIVALHDADLESYLALRMPAKLDFFVEEWKRDSGKATYERQYRQQVAKKNQSTEAFKLFFEAKTKRGAALLEGYAQTRDHGDPEWTARAALRTAWVSAHMADELVGTAVPESLRGDEMRAAYCEALGAQVQAPLNAARDAATHCVELTRVAALEGDTPNACRELLGRLSAQ